MALTKDFRETIRARAQKDAGFRKALLLEAVELMLSGEVETGRSMIRNYINATLGFPELAERVGTPEKSLIRMFGPNGNPTSKAMFSVIAELAKSEKVNLAVKPMKASLSRAVA